MQPIDFSKGKSWLIKPESFEVLARKFTQFHWMHTDRTDAVENLKKEMVSFRAKKESQDLYNLRNGIAIIPISGPLSKRMSFFSFLMGGSSFAYISKAFRSAIDDPEVEGIVLRIDSPGGTISGTEALGDLIFSARDKKPIIAFADGMMASAAYWIGSAADAIVGESTADIGSIGVLMIHQDFSKMDEKRGLKITYLTAGKYKALGNDAEPLGEFARSVFQDELDYIYEIFINTVARNRGIEGDQALDMADGRIFIGQQAKDIGLIDYVGNLNKAIELAKASSSGQIYNSNIGANSMDIKELKEKHPDLVLEIHGEGVKEGRESIDVDKIKNEEGDRILGLADVQFGEGEGGKLRAVVETGVTVDQFKAVKGTMPEKAIDNQDENLKDKMIDVITDAGPDNPGSDTNTTTEANKDFMTMVQEYKFANGCTIIEAQKAILKSHPKKHAEYIKSVN
jgi:signal peptide peptidase SppA